ncbi:MAG: alpha/beta hydrolase [Rhizobiaceae bacterium]
MSRIAAFILTFVLAGVVHVPASMALELAPHKDAQFAYPAIIGDASNPLDLVIDYNELRDINGRDEVPERRVKRAYISLSPRKLEKDMKIESPAGDLRTMATGTQDNAAFIVVYLHGKGGNRRQGSNDYTFGGNFNRIRNLAALNGGLYLTPDFTTFDDKGAQEVKSIIETFLARSPGAKLVVACGSMGGFLCHRLSRDADLAQKLSGMMFLGSFPDDKFKSSVSFKAGMPVFIGHGTNDVTSPLATMEAFASELRAAGDKSRVMMHRFQSGSHGTPVRMSDWRLVLNWMFAR